MLKEERPSHQETALKGIHRVHSNDVSVATELQRIVEKAKKELSCQFTRLFHLTNEELLLECFDRLRHNAASGIDHVTLCGRLCCLLPN